MTAKELFGKHFNGLHYDDISPERIEKYAIEFAKYHVIEALEAAAENVIIEGNKHEYELDKESILNAYPEENII